MAWEERSVRLFFSHYFHKYFKGSHGKPHPKKYLDFEILKILSVYVGTKAEYVGELGIENL